MKTKTFLLPHDMTDIGDVLIDLFKFGSLFTQHTEDDYEKISLTLLGQAWVRQAVQCCLALKVVPDCSVNPDRTVDGEILLMNKVEYDNLLGCLKEAIAEQARKMSR